MGTCSNLSPLRFSNPSLSLDCVSPQESVCTEVFTPGQAFHLNIAKADLQVRLVPKTFSIEIPNFPDPEIRVGPVGEIRSSLPIRDNELPLMLRSLLTFHDIQLDGPWDLDVAPDRLLVGEYGGLHFIFGTSSDWYERIADPGSYPDLDDLHEFLGLSPPPEICAPLGWEDPARPEYCEIAPQPWHDLTQCCFDPKDGSETIGCTPSPWPSPSGGEGIAFCGPWEFASPEDPRLDLTITPWLPAWLAQDNGRLPDQMSWLELAHRFLSRPKDKNQEGKINKLLNKILLADGSRPLKLSDLLDQGEATLSVEEFSLTLDPMEISGIRLLSGEIRSAPEGLNLECDIQESTFDIRANLSVELSLEVPGLGSLHLESPIFFQTQLKQIGSILELVPGSTALEFSSLKLNARVWEKTLQPVFHLAAQDSTGEFEFRLKGEWGEKEKSSLDIAGQIPIAVQNGRYRWEELPGDLEIFSSLKFRQGSGPRYEADLYLNSFLPAPFISEQTRSDLGLRIHLDLAKEGKTLLTGGDFQLQRIEAPEGRADRKWLYLFHGAAEEFRMGELLLKNPALRAELEQIPNGDTETHFLIPQFSLSANPRASPGGLLGGFLEIAIQGREDPLKLVWIPGKKEIRIVDLDLQMSAQGIALPRALRVRQAKWRQAQRRTGEELPPAAATIGMDGRVQGRFDLSLDPLSGKGDLRLVGDPKGDVYFLDPRGRAIRPPLIRDTRWSFRRFDALLLNQGFALGAFRLVTRLNAEALRNFGYGLPLDVRVIMSHRDVMLKPGGIEAANRVYYRKLLHELKRKSGMDFLLEPEGGRR